MRGLVRLWCDILEPSQAHALRIATGLGDGEDDSGDDDSDDDAEEVAIGEIVKALSQVPQLTSHQWAAISGLTELFFLESLLSARTPEGLLTRIQRVCQAILLSQSCVTRRSEYQGDRLQHLFPDEEEWPNLVELLGGNLAFADLFAPWNMKHDRVIQDHFPLIRSLSQGIADVRLVAPLPYLLSMRRHTMRRHPSERPKGRPLMPSTTSIKALSLQYLDVTKATYLHGAPPPSQLRLHSEASLSGNQLWARKTLGKLVGYAFLLAGGERVTARELTSSSRSMIRYQEVSYSVKVRQPVGPPSASEHPISMIIGETVSELLMGVLTALHDWTDARPTECWELIRGQLRSSGEGGEIGALAGLLLGMGLMGRLPFGAQIGAIEMLSLLSHGNPLFEAAAAVALAATNSPCPELRRLLQVNFADAGGSQQVPAIDKLVQSASALALGLVERQAPQDGRSGSTGPLLQRLMYGNEISLTLHCGVALALMGKAAGLTQVEISRCLELIREPPQGRPHSIRAAACLALARQSLDSSQLTALEEMASLEDWSFDDWLLHRVILRAFHQRSLSVPPMPPQHLQILMTEGACLRYVGDCLALGLLSLTRMTTESEVTPSVPADLPLVRVALGELAHRKALDYQDRRSRLLFGYCHDLLLLAWAMLRRGTSDEKLVKLLSTGFDQPLDYCYGRALIHGLALFLLSFSPQQRLSPSSEGDPCMPPSDDLIMVLFLVAILPLPSLEAPRDPALILRHLLPLLMWAGMSGRRTEATDDLTGVHESLRRWVEGRGGISEALPKRLLDWFIKDVTLFLETEAGTVAETVELLRILV